MDTHKAGNCQKPWAGRRHSHILSVAVCGRRGWGPGRQAKGFQPCLESYFIKKQPAAMGTGMAVPQKIKHRNSTWSSNPTSGHITKGTESSDVTGVCTRVHGSVLHNNHKEKQHSGGWLDKQNALHSYNGILLSLKKEIDTRYHMDEPQGHYAHEISPSQKGLILYDSNYMRSLGESDS